MVHHWETGTRNKNHPTLTKWLLDMLWGRTCDVTAISTGSQGLPHWHTDNPLYVVLPRNVSLSKANYSEDCFFLWLFSNVIPSSINGTIGLFCWSYCLILIYSQVRVAVLWSDCLSPSCKCYSSERKGILAVGGVVKEYPQSHTAQQTSLKKETKSASLCY